MGKIYINWETETGAKYRVRACCFMYTVFAAGLRSGDWRYKCTRRVLPPPTPPRTEGVYRGQMFHRVFWHDPVYDIVRVVLTPHR